MPDFEVVFVESTLDGPLSGHAWMDRKEYVYFDAVIDKNGDVSGMYKVYRLCDSNLIVALASRKLFEDLVGTHYSYPNDDKLKLNGISSHLFYKNKKIFGYLKLDNDDAIGVFSWEKHFSYRQQP